MFTVSMLLLGACVQPNAPRKRGAYYARPADIFDHTPSRDVGATASR
ncbi:MAG: hypothetical protein M3032_00715 [Verrucomicrobiota bacterium]|nr:hypothetical protein [Verrucomicrobiota bacterium]